MATYKGIQGYSVQKLSSDPSATSDNSGKLWYNSGTGKFKIVQTNTGAWASGTDFPSAMESSAAFGTATAAVFGCGYDGSPGTPTPAYSTTTYEYNGTTWSGPATTAHQAGAQGAFGTQTAGLIAGGYIFGPNSVYDIAETYDGSTWTEVGDLNTARQAIRGTGSTTAGIFAGGTTGVGPGPSQAGLGFTETYDGSTWTEDSNLNTARRDAQPLGSTNAASTAVLAGGASSATVYTVVEKWDGTSWTELNNINTGRYKGGGASSDSTSGIIFSGYTSPPTAVGNTESWDGTSWTEVGDLASARAGTGGTGTASAALCIGGWGPSVGINGLTEEWVSPNYAVKTVTVS